MIIEATASGKTVEEAKEAAMLELGVTEDSDFEFEIISLPAKKVLGLFGGSDAKVRVFMDVAEKAAPKAPEKKPVQNVQKPAQKAEQKPAKPAAKPASASKATEQKPAPAKPVEKAADSEKPNGSISDAELENVKSYLQTVLTQMGVADVKITAEITDEDVKLNFDGAKLGVAIGRKGETLAALQHLVSLVANRSKEDYVRITLNPGGYREKREETLVEIANKSAAQAIKTGKNVMLEPMNSYERRIIHNIIQDIEGVTSWSIGENEHRRVCIGTSRDNKFASEDRRGGYRDNYRGRPNNRGGYRPNGGRGRNDRDRRPESAAVDSKPTRAPRKDTNDLPLYGVIKK